MNDLSVENTESIENTQNQVKPNRIKNFFVAILHFIKRHKILTIFVLIVIIAAIIFCSIRSKMKTMQEMAAQVSQIQSTPLTKMDLTSSISVTGTIASAYTRSVSTSVKDVEVTKVNVAVGDYVEEGTILCLLDSSTLEDDLEESQADYSLAKQKKAQTLDKAADSITEAQTNYDEGVSEQADNVSSALTTYNEKVSARDSLNEDYEKAKKL